MGGSQDRLKRKLRQIPQRKKFILVTEGKNTEPEYFRAVRRQYRGTLIEIDIHGAAGAPITIAEKAIAIKKELRRGLRQASWKENDDVWAVFDRDDHPHVDETIRLCLQHDIGIAFSNTCFELWLILHFEPFNKLDDRHKVQKHLQNLCPEYDPDKGKALNCGQLMARIPNAEKCAGQQIEARIAEGNRWARPVTTVGNLTAAIRKAAEGQKR